MACSCHPNYEFYCVIELGKKVVPKYEILPQLNSNIMADDSSLDEEF